MGVIYVCNTVLATIYALNASTGVELWSLGLDVGIVGLYTSPAVANGVVFVSTDSVNNRTSNSGHLYALNASTGSELWSYNPGDAVYSSPTVANGVVYFSALHGTFYALNASTGAKLWSFTTGAKELSSLR